MLKHKENGYVYDKTRHRIFKIKNIGNSTDYYRKPRFYLEFEDRSFTHFLTPKELNDLYPYLGDTINETTLKVLFGASYVHKG